MEISYYGTIHKLEGKFYIEEWRGMSWKEIEENFLDNCPKNNIKLKGRSVKITLELK